MANPAKRLLMEPYPEDEFIKAVKEVVLANQDFVPPYGSSGTPYLRPFMIGTQPIVGVSPSETYQFRIYATPILRALSQCYMKSATMMCCAIWHWTSKNCQQLCQQLITIFDCKEGWFRRCPLP